MANSLTGSFDVVAEFSAPGANRVLAAMHRAQRFLHSISVRLDDTQHGPVTNWPTVIGAVDAFGDSVANQQRIGHPNPFPGASAALNPAIAALDPVVNIDQAGTDIIVITPSNLQGTAQLQLSAPTVQVPDSSGTNLMARIEIMSRYLPDRNTTPLPEFIRGELQITAGVTQVASQAGNVLDINFKAQNAVIDFVPVWSSQPLTAANLAGINLAIRNGLITSFLPSNVTLPSNVAHIQFKTLQNPQNALAILLNFAGAAGDPASMNSVFLTGSDDFGFAVGIDYIRTALQPTINSILSQTYNITIPINLLFTTAHVTYAITFSSATVDLQTSSPTGKIVLTVQGTAKQTSNKWYAPGSFTFTATLSFSLTADGDTVDLNLTNVSLNTSSGLVNLFSGAATSGMEQVANQALQQSGAYTTVNKMCSATANLGPLLSSLLPPFRRFSIGLIPAYQLAYTSVSSQPAGLVLHGALSVNPWPPVDVEFEQIPVTSSGPISVNPGNLVGNGPDYSALNSWIPGGLIQQYEWSSQGQSQPFLIDDNKFVLIHTQTVVAEAASAAGAITAYSPLCLTVQGTRLSSSGPVVAQPVAGTACAFNSFPVISGLNAAGSAQAFLALCASTPSGRLVVVGYTAAQLGQAGQGSPNRLVHFADDTTSSSLGFLTQALVASKRNDAPTAIIAVLTPDQLSKASYIPNVIYAEERANAWANLFRVNTAPPLTLIVGPKGDLLWQQEGQIDVPILAAALQRYLSGNASVQLGVLRSNLRIGQPVPNFLFQDAPGHELTLRKLAGRPCTLIFWKSSLKPSLDAISDLQKASATTTQPAVVLAINDGELPNVAQKVAVENGFSAIVVPDPKREISSACGVSLWPMIVFTDASGLITGIRYGRASVQTTTRTTSTPSAQAVGS